MVPDFACFALFLAHDHESVKKMAAMLQVPRVFPLVRCLGSEKADQCPRPGPKIGDKSQQIPRYSPVCTRGQPPGMAADKCITLETSAFKLFTAVNLRFQLSC